MVEKSIINVLLLRNEFDELSVAYCIYINIVDRKRFLQASIYNYG
jgi:hypothetical protein